MIKVVTKHLTVIFLIIILLLGGGAHAEEIERYSVPIVYADWIEDDDAYDPLLPGPNGMINLCSRDLSSLDLSDKYDVLLLASFDTKTTWPDKMAPDFVPEKIMELGKDPGMKIRELHSRGITGKGVGIAIIDQTLLVDHAEYASKVKSYTESEDVPYPAMLHGCAVASIAVGQTVGVAIDSVLYYVADNPGRYIEDSVYEFEVDLSYFAEDIELLIEKNKAIDEEEKICIISISRGWGMDDKGADRLQEAIKHAEEQGIAVISTTYTTGGVCVYRGMGRTPMGDPNNNDSYGPGIYWKDGLYNSKPEEQYQLFHNVVLIPMDSRCVASPTGPHDYAYYVSGGESWTVPYVAGLYALARQVKQDLSFPTFSELALQTAIPAYINHDGDVLYFGNIINVEAIISELEE